MARNEEPLLAGDRPASVNSDERNAEEEDALLTGQHTAKGRKSGWAFWREVGIFVWAVIATAAVIVLAVVFQHQRGAKHPDEGGSSRPVGKRNLIFMVSDGMGPTSLELTRSFRQFESGLPPDDILVLDQHLIGSSRTRSSSSLVTDSAAGATAFSCGFKSYNGAISVLPDHSPCGTVLEAAKKAGYTTGLVVTTRITDATPACFASHANMRTEENSIARQMVGDHPLGRVVDLMFGGGRCYFLSNSTQGSCRSDNVDVVKMAKDNGFKYLDDRKSFDGLDKGRGGIKLPVLGLFASTDIPYEIDRRSQNDVYPSLDEMAVTAMNALQVATKDTEKGFFLMIEGSRIDHAGHGNDPAAQVHEVLAYDKAFTSVLDFLEKSDVTGVAVSTSDHETGGLAAARQLHPTYPEYLWYPSVLGNASHSGEKLAADLYKYASEGNHSPTDIGEVVKSLVKDGLGIKDTTSEEIISIVKQPLDILHNAYNFADIISRRAQTGWSTHGHSGVDVNIYTSDRKQAQPLLGNHENTEVGKFLADYLDLDVEAITKELQSKSKSFKMMSDSGTELDWMGAPLPDFVPVQPDHYHGDFKRSLDCGHLH